MFKIYTGCFCLQNCLHSSWHRFNKVLETFLRDFGPYWHDCIMQLLQICWLHIHDVNLLFHHIPNTLYWIEIWWLWRPFKYNELIVMFKKPVWDDLSFLTWHVILLEVATTRWVHYGHKGRDMVSINTQGRPWHLNDAQLVPKCAKKISPTTLHHHLLQPEPLIHGRMDPCFHVIKWNVIHWILSLFWSILCKP